MTRRSWSMLAVMAALATLASVRAPRCEPAAAATPRTKPRAWVDSTHVGADVHGLGRHVHCRLELADEHPRLDHPVRFVARLTYTGPDSIYLPTVYPEVGRTTMPQSWIEVTGQQCDAPLGNEVTVSLNFRPLEEEDFRVLHTGESIYCGSGTVGDSVITSLVDYRCAGPNRVEFHYRTRGVTGHTWLEGNPDRPSARLVAILRRVPDVDLFAQRDVSVKP